MANDNSGVKRLEARWLGTVEYSEALAIQQAMFVGDQNHLLLLEHPPTYTMGVRASIENLLADPADLGAALVESNRGGDVTFHGPGQLVGYPILNVVTKRGGGMADTAAYVGAIESLLIEALSEYSIPGTTSRGEPGVWVADSSGQLNKIAAIGVRLGRGRSMHGFALNVNTDLDWFGRIVPCGITDKGVTSMSKLGVDVAMSEVVEVVMAKAHHFLAPRATVSYTGVTDRVLSTDVAPFTRGSGPGDAIRPERAGVPVSLGKRLDDAGVSQGIDLAARKPDWMKVRLQTTPGFNQLKKLSSELDLVTVCAEAGCPNIYECWDSGTATFMLLGERCTRACGFCLVDTQRPLPVDEGEPERVAGAVAELGLDYVVLTMVARDDLGDGGAGLVAATIRAIRGRNPGTKIEVLISDLKGSEEDLATVLAAEPDVLNHNTETVPRLQRAVRPSASYARSLSVLARSRQAGFITKTGLIVGMGESKEEVEQTLTDLAGIGVDIVTIGQYLRPTTHHLPINRWWTPDEFDELAEFGLRLGIGHIEASPLTRSSHHAAEALTALIQGASVLA